VNFLSNSINSQIAIPVSLGIAFGLQWGLFGLWMGPAIGLFL
jgi:hypothetical protein